MRQCAVIEIYDMKAVSYRKKPRKVILRGLGETGATRSVYRL